MGFHKFINDQDSLCTFVCDFGLMIFLIHFRIYHSLVLISSAQNFHYLALKFIFTQLMM